MDTNMNTELAWIQAQIDESVRVHRALGEQVTLLAEISRRMARVFQDGGRVFFCGNGGGRRRRVAAGPLMLTLTLTATVRSV